MARRASRKRKGTATSLEVILTSIAFILALFWMLPFAHNWATGPSLPFNLHFECLHTPWCVLYGLIWFVLGLVGVYYLTKKQDMPNYWALIFLALAVIGIVLMQVWITPCSTGAPTAGGGGGGGGGGPVVTTGGTCSDSDGGMILDVQGKILPPSVWDNCVNSYVLKEFFCISNTTYSSSDVDCRDNLGVYACCKSGACTLDCDLPGEPTGEPGTCEPDRGYDYGVTAQSSTDCYAKATSYCANVDMGFYGDYTYNELGCCSFNCYGRPAQNCWESDDGVDYYTYGYCTDGSDVPDGGGWLITAYGDPDYCMDTRTLYESWCNVKTGLCEYQAHVCDSKAGYSCCMGACVLGGCYIV